MLGAVAFLLFFILIAPKTRGIVVAMLGHTSDWITNFAPFSYIILALVVAAGFLSVYLMTHWPKVVEPEDPLARYKNGDDVVE